MTAPYGDAHFRRLMEVLQPTGGLMFIVEGYFDESGDLEVEPGIFCISGYFIATEQAKLMDQEWGAVLAAHNIPYFHMVDCAHGNGVFEGMPVTERVEIVKELIALIKNRTREGFSILAKAGSYDPPPGLDAPDVYSNCASSCVQALQMFLKMNRIEGNIAYFFEQGHKNRHSAYSHIAQKIKREADSLTFAAKEKVRLLQAADLLAWQSTKYAKDYAFARWGGEEPKRTPRKDFKSLMEHDHTFLYMGVDKTMGIELWPMTKRSPSTVNVSMEDDGPVLYWREDGDDTPIIPVEKTIGWRMGGAQFAYLGFNGFKDNKFALAFDEPRLFEAAAVFLQATGLFENSQNLPLFTAENLSIDDVGGVTMLRIKLRRGASIGFRLPPEIVAQLKDSLAKK